VIAGFAYRSVEGPRYFAGHGLLIGTVSMSFILSLFMHTYLKRENARRDALHHATAGDMPLQEYYTEERKNLEKEMGDNASVCLLALSLSLNRLTPIHHSSSGIQSDTFTLIHSVSLCPSTRTHFSMRCM
jgi:hypothetical protein